MTESRPPEPGDDTPPLFRSWTWVYLFVLAILALLIGCLTLLSRILA